MVGSCWQLFTVVGLLLVAAVTLVVVVVVVVVVAAASAVFVGIVHFVDVAVAVVGAVALGENE